MIELRREQFLLKDCFRPVVGIGPGFQGFSEPRDDYGMCIGNNILCAGEMMVDFGDWRHIYAMLKFYSGMKAKIIDNPYHPWWPMYDFLEELIDRVSVSGTYHILVRKIDKYLMRNLLKEL